MHNEHFCQFSELSDFVIKKSLIHIYKNEYCEFQPSRNPLNFAWKKESEGHTRYSVAFLLTVSIFRSNTDSVYGRQNFSRAYTCRLSPQDDMLPCHTEQSVLLQMYVVCLVKY